MLQFTINLILLKLFLVFLRKKHFVSFLVKMHDLAMKQSPSVIAKY